MIYLIMVSPEGSIENKENFRHPDLIIDFIRHGKKEYGKVFKDKILEIGQDIESFKLMPRIDDSILDPKEQLEGRVTIEGINGLKRTSKRLAEIIDKENEIVGIMSGPRTRHIQSAKIIEEELLDNKIDVVRPDNIKINKNLVDIKGGGWYTFIDYILKHQGKNEADLEQFWWEMYGNKETRDDMKSKGYEHLGDVGERTEKVVELLRRFTRRYDLGKTLRVICVTSDINLEQIQQKALPLEKRDQLEIENASVFEIKLWNDKEKGLVLKEEISKPFEQMS
jgi:broad specificity phosphatase PhoE